MIGHGEAQVQCVKIIGFHVLKILPAAHAVYLHAIVIGTLDEVEVPESVRNESLAHGWDDDLVGDSGRKILVHDSVYAASAQKVIFESLERNPFFTELCECLQDQICAVMALFVDDGY